MIFMINKEMFFEAVNTNIWKIWFNWFDLLSWIFAYIVENGEENYPELNNNYRHRLRSKITNINSKYLHLV